MGAMWATAVLTLAALPLVGKLTAKTHEATQHAEPDAGLKQALKDAFADRSYWLLHAGFFTCGFHIAFLVTHLPGEVDDLLLAQLGAAVERLPLRVDLDLPQHRRHGHHHVRSARVVSAPPRD